MWIKAREITRRVIDNKTKLINLPGGGTELVEVSGSNSLASLTMTRFRPGQIWFEIRILLSEPPGCGMGPGPAGAAVIPQSRPGLD
jgi:hypothetical protein